MYWRIYTRMEDLTVSKSDIKRLSKKAQSEIRKVIIILRGHRFEDIDHISCADTLQRAQDNLRDLDVYNRYST